MVTNANGCLQAKIQPTFDMKYKNCAQYNIFESRDFGFTNETSLSDAYDEWQTE